MGRKSFEFLLDAIDRRLIALLDANARQSLTDLARAIGMAPQSVSERLKRLEDAGVVLGYSAKIDPRKLGAGVGAYIRIRPMMGELSRVADIIRGTPEIVECDRITGDDCFMAKAYVADIADLERVIDRLIAFAQTNTSLIQSSPVQRRLPGRSEAKVGAKTASPTGRRRASA